MTPLPSVFLGRPLAHRGLHDRKLGVIENSRAAVEAAVAAGYGVEIDLQQSADGEAMVFHDDDLDRLTAETGPTSARSTAELARLTLKDGAEGIPTLAEVLDIVRGRSALLIEFKDQSGCLGKVDGRLERRAISLLANYRGPVALMSFNPCSVAVCKAEAPHLARGRVTCLFEPAEWPDLSKSRAEDLNRIADLDKLGASFISHDHTDLSNPLVQMVKDTGRHILCWTTKSADEDAAARKIAENVTFENYAA